MKVSLITVVYNAAPTIRDCIDSVISQSHLAIEYIIIDGQSTDGTVEIIQSYGNKITQFVSEQDKGIYDAMNKGIHLATGEVIGILNADDLYNDTEVVADVIRTFQQTGCDGVYGDLVYVAPFDLSQIRRYWRAGAYKPGDFLWGWMPPHPTFFVKRDIYEQYGDFSLLLHTAADYELMLRFIHKNRIKIHYLRRILVKMRAGGASNRSLASWLQGNRGDRKAWTMNGLRPYLVTRWLKPLRKIPQFLILRNPKAP